MLYRLNWKGAFFLEACIHDALGIDHDHPDFKAAKTAGGRNRDTWQSRVLADAHKKAKSFHESAIGQEKWVSLNKG